MDWLTFVVPGIGNSGPTHWQSLWQARRPDWRRLQVEDWDRVTCDDWVSALERQVAAQRTDAVVVAHSLGCLAVAHWAVRHAPKIRGALFVAVPDPAAAAYPAGAIGFSPLPAQRLPFTSIIVASTDDPYGSMDHAHGCARTWGSKLVDVGALGHINTASAVGDWPEGLRLLEELGGQRTAGQREES